MDSMILVVTGRASRGLKKEHFWWMSHPMENSNQHLDLLVRCLAKKTKNIPNHGLIVMNPMVQIKQSHQNLKINTRTW